ncbi:MAG: CRISPR-associated protein Cas4 [Kiritimatiellia bacterium]
MSDADDELVMLSALQHYLFCPRQCALIHVESVWSNNYLTMSGRVLHDRVDRVGGETRGDVHFATSLRLVSHRLGLTGVADKVEFRRVDQPKDEAGCVVSVRLPGRAGYWRPRPVEYKRGRPKEHRADEVQLCGQALCLEEMLGVTIPRGDLFYGATRRRVEIAFDEELRRLTQDTANYVRELFRNGVTPPPIPDGKCEACSLRDQCRPEETSTGQSARRWLESQLNEVLGK